MSKEQWIADVERIEEDYVFKVIDADEFRAALRSMYFKDDEIEQMKAVLDQDRDNDGTL